MGGDSKRIVPEDVRKLGKKLNDTIGPKLEQAYDKHSLAGRGNDYVYALFNPALATAVVGAWEFAQEDLQTKQKNLEWLTDQLEGIAKDWEENIDRNAGESNG